MLKNVEDINTPYQGESDSVTNASNEMTAMYNAWSKYVADTLEKLISYRKGNTNQWFFDISNINEVKALISDLQEMTTHIPFNNQNINMTKYAHVWFAGSSSNYPLSDLFK